MDQTAFAYQEFFRYQRECRKGSDMDSGLYVPVCCNYEKGVTARAITVINSIDFEPLAI